MVDSAALALVLPSLSAHYVVLPVPRHSAGLLSGLLHVPTAQHTEPALKPKAHTAPPLHPTAHSRAVRLLALLPPESLSFLFLGLECFPPVLPRLTGLKSAPQFMPTRDLRMGPDFKTGFLTI